MLEVPQDRQERRRSGSIGTFCQPCASRFGWPQRYPKVAGRSAGYRVQCCNDSFCLPLRPCFCRPRSSPQRTHQRLPRRSVRSRSTTSAATKTPGDPISRRWQADRLRTRRPYLRRTRDRRRAAERHFGRLDGLDPRWSRDGRTLYFLSDRAGIEPALEAAGRGLWRGDTGNDVRARNRIAQTVAGRIEAAARVHGVGIEGARGQGCESCEEGRKARAMGHHAARIQGRRRRRLPDGRSGRAPVFLRSRFREADAAHLRRVHASRIPRGHRTVARSH